MTEETQPTVTEDVVTSEPSLDDVISEYSVKEVPQAQQPAPQMTTEQAAPQIPTHVDPLDESSFKNYASTVAQGQSVLNQQLSEVKSELTQLRQERAELQIEADINSAVETINEGLDLDPKMVRVFLEYTAQEKPGFKNIWDQRKANPAAYDKALKAMNREMGEKWSNKADSELVANQQAIQQSQKSLASKSGPEGSGNSIEDALNAATTQSEFDRIWRTYSSLT